MDKSLNYTHKLHIPQQVSILKNTFKWMAYANVEKV